MKTAKYLLVVSFITFSMTTSVFASWWNPLTWFHKKVNIVKQVQPVVAPVVTPQIQTLQKEASTSPLVSFTCGVSTVNDADGNTYNTVLVGSQCWMKQNMRVGKRIDASIAQTNNSIIEKYCWDDKDINCTSNDPNQPDGGLYRWDEAMQYSTTTGAQGICPSGWHVPTDDQFTALERAICTSQSCATDFSYNSSTVGHRGTNEGTYLKPNGSSKFEINIAGAGLHNTTLYRGLSGALWSSSETNSKFAWDRSVQVTDDRVDRGNDQKFIALSIRCLKGGTESPGIVNNTVSVVTTTISTTTLQNQVEKVTGNSLLNVIVPKDKIETIGFYGFGDIGTSTIDILRNTISEQIGTPSFYMGHVPGEIPMELYNKERKQYDGDALWDRQSVDPANKKVRAVGVYNVDLYTSVSNDTRPYIMSRAFPNVNTTVISLYRLHNLSDTLNAPASKELFESRAKKLILRNLGASVGLQATASANDPKCIMSKADTLADLDKKTGKLCPDEAQYFKKAFLNQAK